jgi:hypothetical protein
MEEVMQEFKQGTLESSSGDVTDRDQAVAIGLEKQEQPVRMYLLHHQQCQALRNLQLKNQLLSC